MRLQRWDAHMIRLLRSNKSFRTLVVSVSAPRPSRQSSYLMDKYINRFVQRHSLPVGHGQEPEAHADVEPFTHADAVERLRILLGARSLILLGLTHSCNEKRMQLHKKKTFIRLQMRACLKWIDCMQKEHIFNKV